MRMCHAALLAIGIALVATGCLTARRDQDSPFVNLEEAIQHRRVELLHELSKVPLASSWDHVIPNERIRSVYLEEDLLFIQTERDWLHVVQLADGMTRWTLDMRMELTARPGLNNDLVALLSQNVLWIVERKTGGVIKKRVLDFTPASAPTPVGNRVYIGAYDRYLYAYNWQNGIRDWRYRTDGVITTKPVFISPTYIAFASHDNTISVLREIEGVTEATYSTIGPISADMYYAPLFRAFYGASRDFGVYAVSGALEWRFTGDDEFHMSPVRVEARGEGEADLVYAISARGTLHAIDPHFGQLAWQMPHVAQYLFRGKGHDYVLRPGKVLSRLDNPTGEVRGQFDLSAFDFILTNPNTNALYVATRDGFFFSMREE